MLPKTRYRQVTNESSGDLLEKIDPPPAAHGLFSYRTAFFVILVVYIVTGVASYSFENISDPGDARLTKEKSTGLPHIPFDQAVLFAADTSYEAYMNGMDDPWTKKLLPPGRGFIKVPTEVIQPDGITKVEDKPFCISMFHQLHCIAELLKSIQAGLKYIFEGENNSAVNTTSEAYIMRKKHMAHCFDFLRQAVMCAGDMTLEPVEDEATNGWNVTHTCRDFKTIYDFAAERRFSNGSGIL